VPWLARLILFGSRARGDHRPRSDVDLALDTPTAAHADVAVFWQWCQDDAPTLLHIEVAWLQECDAALRERVAAEGQVIHDRDRPGTGELDERDRPAA
jgi:proline iminopeptidase